MTQLTPYENSQRKKSWPGVHQVITSETMGAPEREQNVKNKKWIPLQNKKIHIQDTLF